MTPAGQPSITSLLASSVERFADRPAVSLWGQTLTYADVGEASAHLADRLRRGGNPAGTRVGVVAPNLPALVTALFAVWQVGAVAVPINARFREYELRRIMRDAALSAAVSVGAYRGYSFAGLAPRLVEEVETLGAWYVVDPMGEVEDEIVRDEAAPSERLGADIAAVLYTSGTTGAPRGALVPHAREVSGARAMEEVLGLIPSDVCIFVVPITHAFGLTCLLACLAAGAHAVLVESTFSFEPTLEAIRAMHATVLHGSPALFSSLLKSAPEGVPELRTGFVAGSACPPSVIERLDDLGMRILNLFGMTEIGAAACCRVNDSPPIRYTTSGHPLPGYELRSAGADGEIQVRGPYVTPGYFQQPEQTATAFTDGWFRTGDLGSIGETGAVRISGRAKEVVHVAGLNVFPAEVEGFLATHPDVRQAAVVGVPHDTMGEVLQAWVVPEPGSNLSPQTILQFARANIAGYKIPYTIHLVPELPLLASGKPDRRALAQRSQEQYHPHGVTHQAGTGV